MVFQQLFGGSRSENRSFVDPNQQPFLDQLYSGASNALNQSLAQGPFQGSLFAQLGSGQQQGINFGNQIASGLGADASTAALNAGLGLLPQGQQFGANAQSIFNNAPSTQRLFDRASGVAQGATGDALVDAASRDTVRALTEGAFPAIARNAANTGNRGSTRTGVREGVALRGAEDRIADISADVRRNLFNDTFQQGLAADQFSVNTQLNANNQLSNAFSQGLGALGQGLNFTGANQGLFFQGGALDQANRQGVLDEQRALFDLQRNDQFDQLGRFQALIGGPNVLSESNSVDYGQGVFGSIFGGRGVGGNIANVQGFLGGLR